MVKRETSSLFGARKVDLWTSLNIYRPIRNFLFQENKNNNNNTPGQNYAEADTGNEDRSI